MNAFPRPLIALVAILLAFPEANGWQTVTSYRRTSSRANYGSKSRHVLSVASREATEASATTKVPYSISRGDGSTGGGGLSMPNAAAADEGSSSAELKRPKVGAEMPLGRPSWFRVPAPSQGKLTLLCALAANFNLLYGYI
jgi:hypothetical protein